MNKAEKNKVERIARNTAKNEVKNAQHFKGPRRGKRGGLQSRGGGRGQDTQAVRKVYQKMAGVMASNIKHNKFKKYVGERIREGKLFDRKERNKY